MKKLLGVALFFILAVNVSGYSMCKKDIIYQNIRMTVSSDNVAEDCYYPETTNGEYMSWGWENFWNVDRTIHIKIENLGDTPKKVSTRTEDVSDSNHGKVDIVDSTGIKNIGGGSNPYEQSDYTIPGGGSVMITYTVKVPKRGEPEQGLFQHFFIEGAQYVKFFYIGIYGYDCRYNEVCKSDEYCSDAQCKKLSCGANQVLGEHTCVDSSMVLDVGPGRLVDIPQTNECNPDSSYKDQQTQCNINKYKLTDGRVWSCAAAANGKGVCVPSEVPVEQIQIPTTLPPTTTLPKICTPYSKRCQGDSMIEICNSGGTGWRTDSYCYSSNNEKCGYQGDYVTCIEHKTGVMQSIMPDVTGIVVFGSLLLFLLFLYLRFKRLGKRSTVGHIDKTGVKGESAKVEIAKGEGKCKKCGKEIKEVAKFCRYCGTRV